MWKAYKNLFYYTHRMFNPKGKSGVGNVISSIGLVSGAFFLNVMSFYLIFIEPLLESLPKYSYGLVFGFSIIALHLFLFLYRRNYLLIIEEISGKESIESGVASVLVYYAVTICVLFFIVGKR